MRLTPAFIDRVYEESVTYKLAPEEDPAAGAEGGQPATAGGRSVEAEMVRTFLRARALCGGRCFCAGALVWSGRVRVAGLTSA